MFKNILINRLLIMQLLGLCFISQALSQSLLDGHFPKKKTGSVSVSYIAKSYDNFYRGDVLTEGNPADFGAISSQIVSIYGQYALSDQLTAVVNLPFISVRNENEINDPILGENKISGLQDLSLFLKARAYTTQTAGGEFTAGVGAGVSLPLSDYSAGSILSIGNRATALDGMLLVQYKFTNGLFFEATPGMSLKSGEVPNAFLYTTKIGYAHSKFYVGVLYGNQTSTDGIDVGGEGFAGPPDLPKTKVNYNVIDLNLYVPISSGIGVSVGYGSILTGRNVGNESYSKVGLSFSL